MKTEDELKEQFEKIRQTGKTNMCDRRAVQYYANEMNYYALVVLCEDSKAYLEFLLSYPEQK